MPCNQNLDFLGPNLGFGPHLGLHKTQGSKKLKGRTKKTAHKLRHFRGLYQEKTNNKVIYRKLGIFYRKLNF